MPVHVLRRILVPGAALVLAAACTPPGGGDRSPAGPTATATLAPAGTSGPLAWAPCEGGIECATLTVPVDHDRPEGATLDLAVARRPAVDASHRIGSVVLNPGGPGGSGVQLVINGPTGASAMSRFDIVSWDPRGVGASDPLVCDEALPAYRALDWTPDSDAERIALDDGSMRIARECRDAADELADHLSTRDSARDLDRLRQALGEERLTFVGYSYGTALGLHHAMLNPDRVRALVLDGVSDPREDLGTSLTGQARALEISMPVALGAATASYDRVMRAAEAGTGPVDPTTVAYAAVAASYQADSGDDLRAALAAAEAGQGGPLRALATTYWLAAAYGPYAAVTCSDLAHPDGPAAYDELVRRTAEAAPRFGAVIVNEMRPCAWWPPAGPTPSLGDIRGAPTILVLGNTGDVATPYSNATDVASDLENATLLTLEGSGHTSLGRSTCIDAHVKRYLEDGTVPPEGTRCR